MISSATFSLKFFLFVASICVLTACGGGAGGSSDNGSGFTTSNTNTKPQASSPSSTPDSSSASSASATSTSQTSKSSLAASSKSAQSKLSSSSKSASSTKSTISGPDTTPPITPSNFVVVSAHPDVIFLSWSATNDNVAVTAYKLYRDGIQIADIAESENYYADYNVAAGKTYTYSLSAGDYAGNWSEAVNLSATATGQVSNQSSNSSKANSSTSSKASSSSSAAVVIGVSFQWQRPIYREDGSNLFEHEIARYELRYKLSGSTTQTTTLIMSPLVSKTLIDIPSDAEFEIATIDTNGLYSQFVPIRPL